jgi:hypothetical protein
MAIPKRLTAARKIVSCFDPAWEQIVSDREKKHIYQDYLLTRNIELLGDPLSYDVPFTVFDVIPLTVEYEPYVNGEETNAWEIFKSHVKSATGIDFTFSGGVIDNEHRGKLGTVYVRDIVGTIIQLANVDGISSFFSMPVGWLDFSQTCLRHRASVMEANVRSAAAKLKPLRPAKT